MWPYKSELVQFLSHSPTPTLPLSERFLQPLLSLFFQRFLQPPYLALSLARYHFLFPLVPSITAQIASVAAVVRFRSRRRRRTPVGHSSLSSSSGWVVFGYFPLVLVSISTTSVSQTKTVDYRRILGVRMSLFWSWVSLSSRVKIPSSVLVAKLKFQAFNICFSVLKFVWKSGIFWLLLRFKMWLVVLRRLWV